MNGRRFVADVMLEKVARWLRIMGLDVAPPTAEEDDLILMYAKNEHRILLTCDKELYKRAVREGVDALLVPDGQFIKQVAYILATYDIPVPSSVVPQRCPLCNGLLEEVRPSQVKGDVPPYVYRRKRKFWRCTLCNKVYWKGSHWTRIRKTLKKINSVKNSAKG